MADPLRQKYRNLLQPKQIELICHLRSALERLKQALPGLDPAGKRDTLCFASGGMLGLIQLGILLVLNECLFEGNYRRQFTRFTGSSVGAFLACLCGLPGATVPQVIHCLLRMKPPGLGPLFRGVMMSGEAFGESSALFSTDYMESVVEKAIIEMGGAPGTTFEQEEESRGSRLVVALSDITECGPCWAGQETTPGMRISLAVALSMCHPALFGFVDLGGRCVTDGGVFRPLPMDAYGDAEEDLRRVLGLGAWADRKVEPHEGRAMNMIGRILAVFNVISQSLSLPTLRLWEQRGGCILRAASDKLGMDLQMAMDEKLQLLEDGVDFIVPLLGVAVLALHLTSVLLHRHRHPPCGPAAREGGRTRKRGLSI